MGKCMAGGPVCPGGRGAGRAAGAHLSCAWGHLLLGLGAGLAGEGGGAAFFDDLGKSMPNFLMQNAQTRVSQRRR